MTKLTMKDLAIKLDSVGVYLDNGTILQVMNKPNINTGSLYLNSYLKTLKRKRKN